MSINKLFLMLKGGSGSGNFGHSGRLGKRGGSSSSASIFSDKFGTVTLLKSGKVSPDKLPSPKEGHIRLYTTTDSNKNLESIEKKGLLTSKARELEFAGSLLWATNGPSDYSSGRAMVAFDVPEDMATKVNNTDYTVSKDINPSNIIATYPSVTWSVHSADAPHRLDKIINTVDRYGKDRILSNPGISSSAKTVIENLR